MASKSMGNADAVSANTTDGGRVAAPANADAAKKQKQQIIVVVLLAALLGVVMTQGKKQAAGTAETVAANGVLTVEPKASTAPNSVNLKALLQTRKNSVRISDDIASRNPFAGRVQHHELDAAPPRVTAVYRTRRSTAAIVGERIVQPGATLQDGQKVLNVNHNGVSVEP